MKIILLTRLSFSSKFLLIRPLLLLLGLFMGPAPAPAQTIKNNAIVIGRVDSITSAVLREQRALWVYVPASARDSTYLPQRYPVVYLLDGDDHFAAVTSMIQQLSSFNGNTVCPEMIVVGIPNTDRMRDLTPTHGSPSGLTSAGELKTSGGGENFTAFLARELLPYVDAHYPTSAHRTLIGHSLGGLLVINTLVHHPGLFDNYVALDPSMWWDAGKLLRQAHEALAQPRFAGRSLFVGVANTMPTGFDTVRVRRDTSPATEFMRSKLALRDELARHRGNGLRVMSTYYPNDTHGSVPLIATYDALRFLFRPYAPAPPALYDLFEPSAKIEPAAFVEAHYRQVSARMGYPVLPPEPLVDGLAQYQLQTRQPARARALFQLNVRSYPTSCHAHDRLGDYYRAQDQPALAAAAYTRALALKETPATRQKLQQLPAKQGGGRWG